MSGDCALLVSLTKAFGLADKALPSALPLKVALLLRSLDTDVTYGPDFGRGLAFLSDTLGELFALPGLDVRAADRGVMLPFASTSLSCAPACFALGVGGSDRIVGVPLDFEGGVAEPLLAIATRGAIGVRAVRVDAREGLSGRLVLDGRSDEAIGPLRYN